MSSIHRFGGKSNWEILANIESARFQNSLSSHNVSKDSEILELADNKLGNKSYGRWHVPPHILDKDIAYISRTCSKLKSLSLCGIYKITIIASGFFSTSSLKFPLLEKLLVSKCYKLESIRITALLLQKLEIYDNPKLKEIHVNVPFSTDIKIKPNYSESDIKRFKSNYSESVIKRFKLDIPIIVELNRGIEDSDLEQEIQVDRFDLSYCDRITDTGLKHLSRSKIKKLVLRNCPNITSKGLSEFLTQSTQLEELTLSGCTAQIPLSIIFSEKFGKLTHIELSEYQGSFEPFPEEKSTSHLSTSLSLPNCSKLNDLALTFLKDWIYLKELRIPNCQELTDEGLKYLAPLQLEKLTLAKSKWLTNSGLKALEQIKSLKIVNVRGCPQVTLQGIQLLSQAIPGIKILHD